MSIAAKEVVRFEAPLEVTVTKSSDNLSHMYGPRTTKKCKGCT